MATTAEVASVASTVSTSFSRSTSTPRCAAAPSPSRSRLRRRHRTRSSAKLTSTSGVANARLVQEAPASDPISQAKTAPRRRPERNMSSATPAARIEETA